jgi:mono/diheme cytochrome c family protein
MSVRRAARWAFIIAAMILVAGIAAAVFATRNLLSGKTGGPVQASHASRDVVARGKYLAEAADCAACHTAPDGAPFAGGLPMASGFGTIYATNITPDPDEGIGRWSAEDFWRALHDGVRRDGRQLYPAMPYTSYRGITRADADAIYAYVMQLRPMKVVNRKTKLNFPFNIRLGMLGWNLLFLHDSLPAVSDGSSAAWAARPVSGERAGALRRVPYAARDGRQHGIVARADRVRARPRRRAGHHTGGAGVARLDGRGPARFPWARGCAARLGVQRHASGDHAQHQKPDDRGFELRCDLPARR